MDKRIPSVGTVMSLVVPEGVSVLLAVELLGSSVIPAVGDIYVKEIDIRKTI